jgi:hypothetical protein
MKKDNSIPQVFDPLSTLAEQGIKGLAALSTLGVTHNTKELVMADFDAAHKAQSEYQFVKDAVVAALKALAAADKTATTLITVTRDNLKPTLGSKYSIAWNKVGFVNGSLAVPSTMDGRVSRVKSIELFFGAEPEREIAGVMTSELAADAHDALVTAISDVSKARSDQREKKAARDAAVAVLRQRMQNLYRELKQFLGPDDQRWLEFGFKVPSDVSTPDAPEGLTVAPGGAGEALLSWNHTVHTDRFNVYQEIVGVDAKPVKVASLTETSEELRRLPTGAHVKFYLTAVNSAGESQPSNVVEMVVP